MNKVEPFTLDKAQAAVSRQLENALSRHQRWRFFENLYRYGDVQVASNATKGEVGTLFDPDTWQALPDIANMVLPHISVIEGSIVARDPKLIATPVAGGPEAEKVAATAQGVVSYFWPRVNGTPRAAAATHDMLVLGNGVLKVGWAQDTEDEDIPDEDQQVQLAGLLESEAVMADFEAREPRDVDELKDMVATSRARVMLDEPFVEYVSPYDFFVDDTATDLDDARWVAQRITLPVDEVEGNSNWSKTARDELTATVNDYRAPGNRGAEWTRKDGPSIESEGDGAWETVTLWEFYDLRTRHLLVFADSAEHALFDDDMPWSNRHSGFVHMRNSRASGTDFWGFSDVEAIASLQQALNEMLTEQMDNARRAGNKYAVDDDVWSDDLKAALESDMPEEVFRVVNDSQRPLSDLILPLERQPLPADVYQARTDADYFMRAVLGLSDFQTGGNGADRMSATAASMVGDVTSIRAAAKAAQVEAGVARVGQLVLLLSQEFLSEPRAVRMSGLSGPQWVDVTSEDLWAEMLVTVEAGSMRRENEESQESKGRTLLVEIAPTLVELGMDPIPAVRQGVLLLGFDPDLLTQLAPPDPEIEPGGPPAGEGAPAAAGSDAALMAQLAGGAA